MERLKNNLTTQKYTYVEHEKDFNFNAPHHFTVKRVSDDSVLSKIDFQEGPIKENGVNGLANEDLIAMVLARLDGFQNSEFKSRDNAMVITKLEEALMWLRKRTVGREVRGVEGTSSI